MVFGSSDGAIWAFQPRTGKPIWNFRMSHRGINITPVVQDDVVYASQGEETLDNRTLGSVAAINGIGAGDITAKNEKWLVKGVTASRDRHSWLTVGCTSVTTALSSTSSTRRRVRQLALDPHVSLAPP